MQLCRCRCAAWLLHGEDRGTASIGTTYQWHPLRHLLPGCSIDLRLGLEQRAVHVSGQAKVQVAVVHMREQA